MISDLLKKIAGDLAISQARYDSAERSYTSIGEWLKRSDSGLKNFEVKVYLQGSFRLGTVIKPIGADEHYDLDIICEVGIQKSSVTQEEFQNLVGAELIAYASSHRMERPEKWDRCWTLNYSDDARFHIDFLPSLPDGVEQNRIFSEQRLSANEFISSSIAIADSKHINFKSYSTNWPVSNPNGYANWFKSKMRNIKTFGERSLAKANVDVADMPVYKHHTPLQLAIRILKRHRDMMFVEQPELKPSSVILTTLASEAYNGETEVLAAAIGILSRIRNYIFEGQDGQYRIDNPTDRRENFADAWNADKKKSERFFDWLETANRDFEIANQATTESEMIDALSPRLGRQLVEAGRSLQKSHSLATLAGSPTLPLVIVDAPHRRPLRWPFLRSKILNIFRVTASLNGVDRRLTSNDLVETESSLTFEASTTADRPYKVFWQVVNTGSAAAKAGDLRGIFDEAALTQGTLTKVETARYPGIHSVQCFIVKDRKCIAKSLAFIVRIQ